MTSAFAILFRAIQNRIKAIQVNGQPAFRWIDQDMMQLESHSGDDRPPVSWPAVTIDIDDATFSDLSANGQQAVVNVCIRIGFPPFTNTSSIVPANYANAALYYYDLEQVLHTFIQGWVPGMVTVDDTTTPPITADLSDIFSPMSRTRSTTERRNDRIRVRSIHYSLSMTDSSTDYLPVFVSATPQLTITLAD